MSSAAVDKWLIDVALDFTYTYTYYGREVHFTSLDERLLRRLDQSGIFHILHTRRLHIFFGQHRRIFLAPPYLSVCSVTKNSLMAEP